MYKIEKLTVKNRCEIPVGSVVETVEEALRNNTSNSRIEELINK
mgnify:CR=1 FL=1